MASKNGLKQNFTVLEPLIASTPRKDRVKCLDLYDSDSSDFTTPTKKRPRSSSSPKCWIELNDSDTSEQVTPIKTNSASPICIDFVDSDDEEQAAKGKLKSVYYQ